MNELLNRAFLDPLAQLTARQLMELGLQHFYAFVLVLVRMSGLMTIGPVFGQKVVPGNIRVLLVLAMALVITPTLGNRSDRAFQRFDSDGNGMLERSEVPVHLDERFDDLLAAAGKPQKAPLLPDEFHYKLRVPATLFDFLWVGVGEFALGLVLGLGMLTILSGLQLAGELFDQQSGIALGEIANPGLEINGSITGQFLFLLGTALFLLMEPMNGHLMMISALVETFQVLPVGDAFVSGSAIELLRDLVHQSLVMGVQIAAPLLATMSLVALTMGFLGHTVPQINVLVIGFPIRALTSGLILAASLSGASRIVVDAIPETIDNLMAALIG